MTRPRRIRGESVQSPLETYLHEINETALLSADEGKELGRRIAEGDNEARDRMVRANLRLVVNIARSYTRQRGSALQDLIEEGNLGLLRAVEKFDPDMNTRFSTTPATGSSSRSSCTLVNTGKTIRVPAYMAELLTKWRQASSKLQDEFGRPPTHDEIAKSLKTCEEEEEAVDDRTGNPRPRRPADGAGRYGLVARRDGDGRRLEIAGPLEMVGVGRPKARHAPARPDGQAAAATKAEDGRAQSASVDETEARAGHAEVGDSLSPKCR